MKRAALASLALLAACGTPQEQCISRATRDLRTVEALIAETQGNLDRGYALETITVWDEVWGWCTPLPPPPPADGSPPPPPPPPQLCRDEVARQVERPRAIDLVEEARKLDQLQAKRRELSRAAEPAIAPARIPRMTPPATKAPRPDRRPPPRAAALLGPPARPAQNAGAATASITPRPPSTVSTCPVTKRAASEARYCTVSASSSGPAIRPSGVPASITAR